MNPKSVEMNKNYFIFYITRQMVPLSTDINRCGLFSKL